MSKVEFFVGGGGDKKDWITTIAAPTNLMESVKNYRQKSAPNITCYYYGHEEETLILTNIKSKWKSGEYKSIRLTGHSWGGQAVMDIAQQLFSLSIPVDELITLDPVSLWPFSKVMVAKWVNIYIKQSLIDNTIGKIPLVGNIASSLLSLPSLATQSGRSGGYIANVGGQLGEENGAYNIELDVTHADALLMYKKAREEMSHAPLNPKVIGVK
ncbi:hypothetical protein EUZ85_01580 [Hahella sp. KA22]|uniref:Alpha/beta hydrolase n=1 Tax=Hahella chejuensis (strain KCTC 2396) TaxID=349521 RepID=Q2S788_HAHCH|nr:MULTISPECIES: hypothetical protein [Hahella]ABC33486.1 hypothetical protein HCH_06868 [Hahella chejuensis KCTC 2396]AZZ95186.1 hypothetical protein ENC22_29870 [Hahella sp. KA22]QAY52831.1 hypothetical protein EUZ85_01580 [Hahella sp. KA22]